MNTDTYIHKSVLRHVQNQVKKHSFGKLVFFSCFGPRSWGFAPDNINFDYHGIYLSKEDNTYWVFVSGAEINNYPKDITLISLERFVGDILRSDIHSFIFINGPIIYASKEFLEFKKWINLNLSKRVYETYQIKQSHVERKDYLYDFFFIGNGISILEKKKVIPNLFKLNKKILKIPAINKIIEEEKIRLPFKDKRECKNTLNNLKARLEKANKESRLPKVVDSKKLAKLRLIKKINLYFWYWPKGSDMSRERER